MAQSFDNPIADDNLRSLDFGTCCRAVAGTFGGLIRPRRPAAGQLEAITAAAAPAPKATVTVRLRALPQIPRLVPGAVVAEGVRSPQRVRIGLRTFVIDHPQARILLDPAVPLAVRDRALAAMPGVLRRAVMPPADILSTVESIHLAGLDPAGFDLALPTHLHWDHVSGLLDLPNLAAVVHRTEWDWAMGGPPFPAAGVRPAMTGRETTMYELDGPPVLTFERSRDLFGDGSVVLVDLAGHTPGSVGVLLHEESGWVLVAGDAVWHHRQIEHAAHKAAFPGLLVDEDRDATYGSILRLAALAPSVRVIPTHDHDLAGQWGG